MCCIGNHRSPEKYLFGHWPHYPLWGYQLYDIFTRGNSEGGPNFRLKFGTLGFCAPEDTYTISALRKLFHMLKNAKTIKNVSWKVPTNATNFTNHLGQIGTNPTTFELTNSQEQGTCLGRGSVRLDLPTISRPCLVWILVKKPCSHTPPQNSNFSLKSTERVSTHQVYQNACTKVGLCMVLFKFCVIQCFQRP